MHNILVLGSGGREHTLCWKLHQSDKCNKLFAAPGNGGTMELATNLDISLGDFDAIKSAIKAHDISMLVVGPEQPLVDGIYDELKHIDNLMIIGPSSAAAQLEGSKAFANDFMNEYNIPTAQSKNFTLETLEEGLSYLDNKNGPYVLKADGLAAGKGVLIIEDKGEAKIELKNMLEGKFGTASDTVVIEDFLSGIEFSVFVLTNGEEYVILPEAKDYKRIGENDQGLNTGGMGAISPVPFVDNALMEKVRKTIIEPTIAGLKDRNLDYKGFIFLGLIKVDDTPYVIEYNCRLGDPETEVVLPRVKNDLLELFTSLYDGTMDQIKMEFSDKSVATVMLVSGGYPETYEKNKVISMEEINDSIVFHAGTKIEHGQLLTNGGRVIAISSEGNNFREAIDKSLINAEKIRFDKKYFRSDIGFDL